MSYSQQERLDRLTIYARRSQIRKSSKYKKMAGFFESEERMMDLFAWATFPPNTMVLKSFAGSAELFAKLLRDGKYHQAINILKSVRMELDLVDSPPIPEIVCVDAS